jgi:hypothetical protein
LYGKLFDADLWSTNMSWCRMPRSWSNRHVLDLSTLSISVMVKFQPFIYLGALLMHAIVLSTF